MDILILGGAVLIGAYLALTPLTMLLYGSFQKDFLVGERQWTFTTYIEPYSDPEFYSLLINSIVYALGVSLFTFLIGTALAWVCERTNTPGRKTFTLLAVATYIIPGVLLTISWILLLSPRIDIPPNSANIEDCPGVLTAGSSLIDAVSFVLYLLRHLF